MLSIVDSLTKFLNNSKEFFIENSRNPFLWVAIILLALLIFEFVYNALKDKN